MPAESRNINRPCVWFGFYDNHDVWHFFSGLTVFFTFLVSTWRDWSGNIGRVEREGGV